AAERRSHPHRAHVWTDGRHDRCRSGAAAPDAELPDARLATRTVMKSKLCVIAIVIGTAPAAFAQAPLSEADQVKSRQKISMIESVLESAVANGADSLMRAVRAV